MAEIIDNQPIIFDEVLDCHLLDSNIKMLAQWGDVSQFQMLLQPCLADKPIVENGGFASSSGWTLGSGWSIADGQACHAIGLFGELTQAAVVADDNLVRITITVDVSEGASLVVRWGTSFIETLTVSGTYTFYFTSASATTIRFGAGGSSAVCVTSVSAVTLNTNFEVYINNAETGALVSTLDTADGYFNFNDGYFTASIDWETLAIPEGCYTIGVFDPCPCSQGGIIALDFRTGVHNWTVGTNWTIGSGTAAFSGSTSSESQYDHVLCADVEYTVSYTIKNLTGNGEFWVRLGSSLGTTRTADGIYTEQITANSTGFFLHGTSSGGAASFDIEEMSIEITDKEATYTSNTIYVNSGDFGCKTYEIAMCSDHDGSGFGFANTGFRPAFRIDCSLARGQKNGVREGYEYSNGTKATTYARSRMGRELGMDLPNHLIFFMYLAPDVNHFYVDDVEYFVDDDEFPTVSWDDNVHQGGFALNISKKQQLLENRRLTSASVGCLPDGNPLADSSGIEILDETHRPITDG